MPLTSLEKRAKPLEDVVGIKVRDKNNGWFGFMTWGRLWHKTDDAELLACVQPFLAKCEGISEPVEVVLCVTLSEVKSAQYFYEGLIDFSRSPIPSGADYKKWLKAKRTGLKKYGTDLYFLGPINT